MLLMLRTPANKDRQGNELSATKNMIQLTVVTNAWPTRRPCNCVIQSQPRFSNTQLTIISSISDLEPLIIHLPVKDYFRTGL